MTLKEYGNSLAPKIRKARETNDIEALERIHTRLGILNEISKK